MAPSTSPTSRSPAEADRYGLAALERFYRFHARIYDWTRPLLLRARAEAAAALGAGPGDLLLDVGCGTGVNLPRLAATGASVVGIEPSAAMRDRAEGRLHRLDGARRRHVVLDGRPYGSHPEYAGRAAGILFSYSLSMIPPFTSVLERARADLRPGGRIVVVDFLDAWTPVAAGLAASHVLLGVERFDTLRRLFPRHRADVHATPLWRYFVFEGAR